MNQCRARYPCCRGAAAFWLLLLLVALPLAGCGGCSGDQQAAKEKAEEKKKEDDAKKKEKEKTKPDFVFDPLLVEPFQADNPFRGVKPGHWFGVSQAMKTNNFDFVGEMASELTLKTPDGRAPQVPVHLISSRPVVLPKGQQRYLELPAFMPRTEPTRFITLSAELRGRGGSGVIKSDGAALQVMPPYQFYFFVLAREQRYRVLERLDSTKGPSPDAPASYYYRIVAPPLDKHVALPAHPMAWTSIAYVLWDDVDPALLSPDQQRAMLDWLHWGGQLILSGPSTISMLRGSFLAPYLPAGEGPTRDISTETLAPLSDYWTPKEGKGRRPLELVHPWSGIQLVKAPEAEFLPHTGELVVERNAGRGRIVATAFRLSLRALQDWPGFDSFFSGCLLRHPPREFVPSSDGLDPARAQWYRQAERSFDARLTSGMRYVSRDLAADGSFCEDNVRIGAATSDTFPSETDTAPAPEDRYGSGVGGWSDASAVSMTARDSLGDAAGIDIPKAGFVAWMLAAYLVVLVPVNWALFKLMRRVEWAWVAVPVIALAGALFVTKAANLNIGFARSQTEIGLLEVQPGYRRAHLTRYTALYTSLSTSYDLRYVDPYAVVQPLALEHQVRPGAVGEPTTYTIRHEADVRLGGFNVSSNSTAMLHSEQMLDLGGAISYSDADGPPTVYNGTSLTFDQASAVRVTAQGELQAAWLGRFPPGEAGRPLEFHAVENEAAELPKWHDDPVADPSIPPLSLKKMAGMVVHRNGLQPGDVRLVASLSRPLAGMEVEPVASQPTRAAVLVVAHLQYAPHGDPLADHGSRQDQPPAIRDELPEPDAPASEVPPKS